ncbi:MAG: adenine-specific DNA-methyltransferase [Acidobacteriota bacterium]|nr:adenine-specific DNA-methyltransferase [Acidobacteriota bacterium]
MEIEKLDLSSMNIVEEQKAKLKKLFPEVFTEGRKIDFERLKATLGEDVDSGKERYGMNWPGKGECFKTIQQPSIATLVPCPEESVNFDTTENLFIEGDNLEVLKLLQKSYLGKIKMIYIDPPYNTGNEFIYPDNYTESLETYLSYTGQIDDEGRKFSTNTETEGRFHSKWLNMMYPRLFLAKNLLRDDGVIFISIDDNEVDNLKKVCNEIFGEENYKGTIVRATGQTTGQDSGGLGQSFDYIFVYSKNIATELSGLPLSDDDLKRYEEEDEKGKYALWQLRKTGSNDRREDRPTMFFKIKDPDGEDVLPIGPTGYESCWRFDRKGYEKLLKENYIVWKKRIRNEKEHWWPYVKTYLLGKTKRPSPLWTDIEGSKKASIDLRDLMNNKIFDNPKPIQLISKIIQILSELNNNTEIVLDFFAGSCTTAHAVLDLNQEDNGNRKFICVQLPEPTDPNSEAFKAGYKTIAGIGKERIRRVIKKINDENKGKLKFEENSIDLGFKVFKLAPSNIKAWNANVEKNPEAVQQQLFDYIDHISHVSREEALLYEILLKSGFELSTKVEKLDLAGKAVYNVAEGGILVCLEKNLTKDLFRAIAEKRPARCVCLDRGFQNDDQLKTNAVQTMKDKGVEFRTV